MGPLTNMYSERRRKAAALRGTIREQEDTATADRELLLAGGVSGPERIDLAVEGVMQKHLGAPRRTIPIGQVERQVWLGQSMGRPACQGRRQGPSWVEGY